MIHPHRLAPETHDWHQLTDEYAAALKAMQRGEPTARERVRALYQQLRRVLRLQGDHGGS